MLLRQLHGTAVLRQTAVPRMSILAAPPSLRCSHSTWRTTQTAILATTVAGQELSRRLHFSTTALCLEATSDANAGAQTAASVPAAAESAGNPSESALEVAMRVNKMKKMHQSGGAGCSKKEVEQEAWLALNSLSEEQINTAEGKAVSLLLNSWAYFAKFWAKGKDGPA